MMGTVRTTQKLDAMPGHWNCARPSLLVPQAPMPSPSPLPVSEAGNEAKSPLTTDTRGLQILKPAPTSAL